MKELLRYGGRTTGYILSETPRLTSKLLIHVHPNGVVEVEAPIGRNPLAIKGAIQRQARWIFDNLDAARDARTYALPREYVSGETHFYLGRRYRLQVLVERGNSSVKLVRGWLKVVAPVADKGAIRQRLRQWYRARAEEYFGRRLVEISEKLDWLSAAPPMKIVPMERQWGSCTPGGSVNLNPALIRAPRHCIDYVLTHELCHLKEHNHSKRFYALLRKYDPNWVTTKAELDRLAELLLAN